MVEQPLVMGDQQHRLVGLAHDAVDARADDPQRIDVEPAIGLVEHREVRLEDAHLDHLGALLLAARKAEVDRPLEHLHVHAEHAACSRASLMNSPPESGLAARLALRVERLAQELQRRHAGNFDRILEAEEQPHRGALVRREREQVPCRRKSTEPSVTS